MRDHATRDDMERCVPLRDGVLTVGGTVFTIQTSAGSVAFEWHTYLGPLPVHKRTGAGRDLPPRHPFWRAVTEWAQNGMVVQRGPAAVLCVRNPKEAGDE